MVKVTCFTNLDLLHEIWPTMLPERPIVGDRIFSATKHKSGVSLELVIVSITWKPVTVKDFDYTVTEWTMLLELHNPRKESLHEFFEWYAHITGKSKHYFI